VGPTSSKRQERVSADNQSTPEGRPPFDFDQYPPDSCFHERRQQKPSERPIRKERRRRIDPTTFEKQYTPEELEFMNAMQQYKVRSGKTFPSFGEVLKVARDLGYRKTGPGDELPG
jgi:hypothetical protein